MVQLLQVLRPALHQLRVGQTHLDVIRAREQRWRGLYTPTLFDDPKFDEIKDSTHGKIFTLLPEDISGDGRVDIDDLQWDYLEGDGDFRSAEVTALLDEADMVITNLHFPNSHRSSRGGWRAMSSSP